MLVANLADCSVEVSNVRFVQVVRGQVGTTAKPGCLFGFEVANVGVKRRDVWTAGVHDHGNSRREERVTFAAIAQQRWALSPNRGEVDRGLLDELTGQNPGVTTPSTGAIPQLGSEDRMFVKVLNRGAQPVLEPPVPRLDFGTIRQGTHDPVGSLAMARNPAELTESEIQFLAERHLATLTTVRPDGSPHVVAIAFGFDPSTGTARVICSSHGQKVRNIAGDNRVALCQVDGRRWLSLEGEAVVTDEPVRVQTAVEAFEMRYRPASPNPDRVALEITIHRVLGRA